MVSHISGKFLRMCKWLKPGVLSSACECSWLSRNKLLSSCIRHISANLISFSFLFWLLFLIFAVSIGCGQSRRRKAATGRSKPCTTRKGPATCHVASMTAALSHNSDTPGRLLPWQPIHQTLMIHFHPPLTLLTCCHQRFTLLTLALRTSSLLFILLYTWNVVQLLVFHS